MELQELVARVPGFAGWSNTERIKLFGWHLHRSRGCERFVAADLRACYVELNLAQPANVNSYLARLRDGKAREVLKDRRGYYLEKSVRDHLDERFGQRAATITVDRLLSELPARVPDLGERMFVHEALTCFRAGAFRAAIVMTWNTAFYHLCSQVLQKHLASFNTALPKRLNKARIAAIVTLDDFAELKELEVVQVCRTAGIIPQNIEKILNEKLIRRNMAAHPSTVEISQWTTEEFIRDLITNVVIRL
jgi:hypothetical protein